MRAAYVVVVCERRISVTFQCVVAHNNICSGPINVLIRWNRAEFQLLVPLLCSSRDNAKAELRMSMINLVIVKLRKLLLSLFFSKF